MKRLLVTLLSIAQLSTYAQYKEPTYDEVKKLFPSEKAATLRESEHLYIETKGNEYNIYTEFEKSMIYLSDKGNVYGNQGVYYSKFTDIKKLKAYSLVPKNGNVNKFKKYKVREFSNEDVYSSSYFYHDSKKIGFQFQGAVAGTKTYYKYKEIIKDPKFLGSAFLVNFVPAIENEYSVTFPSNVEVLYKEFNFEGNENMIEFTKTQKGDLTTYTWKTKNQKAYESIENAPNLKYYAPHVSIRIGKIQLKDSTINVLPNLDALYGWYNSLVDTVNANEDSTLKAITLDLVKDVKSRDEKARVIFNWVQDNIKYVAFEDGMGGFIPRPAARVCRNRYGDCKDMSSIITDMLKYANVGGNLTWIGSRDLPYRYSEVPTPIVDNHMIASYENEKGERVFLDAVGSYTPYGYPTGFIQGKEALVGFGKDKYEVHQVPIISKELNAKTDSISISIKENKIIGKGSIHALGYAKLDFVYPLVSKNPKDRKDRLQRMLEKGNNKFLISSATFNGLEDRDKAAEIKYDFTIGDYAKNVGDEIFINLNLEKTFSDSKIEIEKRKGVAIEFEYQFLDNNFIELTIPQGYKLEYLPKNAKYESDQFGFEISYEEKNGLIFMRKKVFVSTLLLEKDQFENWNNMMALLNAAYKDVVILKK